MRIAHWDTSRELASNERRSVQSSSSSRVISLFLLLLWDNYLLLRIQAKIQSGAQFSVSPNSFFFWIFWAQFTWRAWELDHFSFNSMLLNSKCHRVWEFHNWAWWRWRDGDYTTTWQFIEQHLNIFKRLWQYQLFLELSVHESFNIVFF